VDLYPTLALLAGLPLPNELDGTSLMPSLKDPQAAGREAVLSQFARPFKKSVPEFMGYSLRTDTHRYTRWISWADRKTVAEELYDYGDNDCAQYVSSYLIEQRNIADSPSQAETKKQLSDQLDQVLQQRVKSLPPPSAGINLPQPPRKKKKS
jgi:iduronate 2-sulfatase